VSPTTPPLCIAIAVAGAAVQSSIGLGFGLVASPILAIVDPDFVPAGILIATFPLSVWVAAHNHERIDRRSFWPAIAGRLPGVVFGTIVVGLLSSRWLALGLAAAVFVAVAVSVWSPPVPVNGATSAAAGGLSGFMGTATGVGGPPIALLYQRHDPQVVRATLAAFFSIGTAMSLVALSIGGGLSTHQWRLGLLLLPGVALGIALSRFLHPHAHGPAFRGILLSLCVLSASVLAIQQLV
jgi:uncharacterized membrane protein YfcA